MIIGCTFSCLPSVAAADGGIQGAQAIDYLNQQRVANGIPPITQVNQNFAAAWCPNEDHGPSGGELYRVLSPSLTWSVTASPWDDAPIHQFYMYFPLSTAAGDVNAGGEACMGLGNTAAQPTSPTFYAWIGDQGPTSSVPSDETVNEGPFAPQQTVGIPYGKTTGPQLLLYAFGLPGEELYARADPHALAWSLSTADGAELQGVKLADDGAAAAFGYPGYLPNGGVMIPPPLKPGTSYRGSVVWQAPDESTYTQTFSFTTALLSNSVSIDAEPNGNTVQISVTSDAPNPKLGVSGALRLAPALDSSGNATIRLSPGGWLACAASGGPGTGYQAGSACTTFTIKASPNLHLSALSGPPGNRYIVLTTASGLRNRQGKLVIRYYSKICQHNYYPGSGWLHLCSYSHLAHKTTTTISLHTSQRIAVSGARLRADRRFDVTVATQRFAIGNVPYAAGNTERSYCTVARCASQSPG
jgi:hypothetical protein